MRHLVRGRKLGRTHAHRKATLQALAIALIREHRIQTTVPKAKELRRFIEPLITRAKSDTMHNRREVFSALQNKLAVKALFEEVAPQIGDRPGGYTRVLKTGFRSGDAAEMALIELVDFNLSEADGDSSNKKKSTRRSRRGKSGAGAGASKAETVNSQETVAEAEVVKEGETSEEAVAEEETAETVDATPEDENNEVVAQETAEAVSTEETASEPKISAEETTSEASSETESEKKDDSDSDNKEEKA